jgi:hypothetical protein
MARGVSELVSAALLALIAITVGGLVVVLLVNQLNQQQGILQELLTRNLYQSRQVVAIVYASTQGDRVEAVAVTGDTTTEINAVYIDGVNASCTLSLTNGTRILLNTPIQPYTAVVITCPVFGTGPHLVRIAYPGGSTTALAQ